MNALSTIRTLRAEASGWPSERWRLYPESYNDPEYRLWVDRIGCGDLDGRVYIQSPFARNIRYDSESRMKAMRPAVIDILNDETYMNVLKHYGRLLELRKLARKMSLLATSEDCEVCTTNEGQIMLFAPSAFEFRLIDCSFFGLIEEILRNDRIAKMFSENPFVGDFVVKAK